MAKTTTLAPPDRRRFLGSSDMPVVLGLSPWKTPYQLWAEKTSESPVPDFDSSVLRRGRRMEPVIVQWMAEDYGLTIVQRNARYVDPVMPFLSCEIDFEYEESGAIENAEVKTVHPSKASEWGDAWTDEIPVYYTVQALTAQMVTGRDSTLFAACIGADDLRPYRVRRDEALIEMLRDKAAAFWDLVESRTPPPLVNFDDALLAWSRSVEGSVAATDEIAAAVRELRLVKKTIAGREAEAELLELRIAEFLQDREQLVDAQGKRLLTWKTQKRKGYTVEPTEFRVMRIAGGE